MKIADPAQDMLVNEVELMLAELPFDGASVLELGCGKAEKTRLRAGNQSLTDRSPRGGLRGRQDFAPGDHVHVAFEPGSITVLMS